MVKGLKLLYCPLTTHDSPLTTHHSPLTTHHSPHNIHQRPDMINRDFYFIARLQSKLTARYDTGTRHDQTAMREGTFAIHEGDQLFRCSLHLADGDIAFKGLLPFPCDLEMNIGLCIERFIGYVDARTNSRTSIIGLGLWQIQR